jgi:serine/threonine protein phosphatase PrpC
VSDLLNNLFGRRDEIEGEDSSSPGTSDLPTQPYVSGDQKPQMSPIPSKPFLTGIGSSVGMQRDHNEDSLFAMTTNLISNSASIPMGLYIVADGMGGHVYGEKASELAIQAMVNHVLPELIPPSLGLITDFREEQIEEIMTAGIRSAHQSIQQNAPGGGSTLTGLLVLGNKMTIAHIGDSRAYHFEADHDPQVLTTDHSLVKRLEDLGQITSDEAAIHPQRNVLYRALGQVEQVDADIISTTKPSSGYLTVCSDGLWGAVSDLDMLTIIINAASPQQASELLLEAANKAGGPDNISVIIIKIPD